MKKTNATLLGLAIGDALGQPFEFCDANMIVKSGWKGDFVDGESGYEGAFKLNAGQFTDDYKMASCLANSLLECNGFDVDNLAKKYIEWVESRDLRGIGIQTERAIHNLIRGISPSKSGNKNSGRKKPSFKRISEPKVDEGLHGQGDYCGCGTVMRCAPIGVFFNDQKERMEAAKKDAIITHNHPDAKDSSVFLCEYIHLLKTSTNPLQDCKKLLKLNYEYDHIPKCIQEALDIVEDPDSSWANGVLLGSRGTAHETLASAVFCFLKHDNFKEAVVSSVLLGGDADSRSCIAGAMAGTYYGLEGIPKEYIEGVEDSKKIQELDKKLFKNEKD